MLIAGFTYIEVNSYILCRLSTKRELYRVFIDNGQNPIIFK
jgi:hypothetical protein